MLDKTKTNWIWFSAVKRKRGSEHICSLKQND